MNRAATPLAKEREVRIGENSLVFFDGRIQQTLLISSGNNSTGLNVSQPDSGSFQAYNVCKFSAFLFQEIIVRELGYQ